MPLPAALLLQPDCAIKAAWAVFDAVWYLRGYREQLPAIAYSPVSLLDHYLQEGARAGHSPSPYFDERYYLARYPEIAALVQAGHFTSGFDHYCQHGHRVGLNPHWLFDDALYASLYEDMTPETLAAHGLHGNYDHYLRSGQFEHRLGHFLFDGRFYAARAKAAGEDAGELARIGPFTHFLYWLASGAAELPPSLYFDPVWYRARQGHLGAPFAGPAVWHYLTTGWREAADPVAEFSERFYRQDNADVRAALEDETFCCGYRHFLQIGVFELRRPSAAIDLAFYHDINPAVRNDLNLGILRDAFAHLRGIGLAAGLPYAPPEQEGRAQEVMAKALFLGRAQESLISLARRALDFTVHGVPELSVIVVMFDRFELTMHALAALRSNYARDMELILVDNASTDQTSEIGLHVKGARIIRLERNIGYLRACNLALGEAHGEFLLFLNNDVELGPDAIAAALDRIRSASDIGAVGGKVVRSHGLLQEAGCIIWHDGSTCGYLRDSSPLAPEANFVREVDFCSGAFLLCRTALVQSLGGFDPAFSPAYYEEADLCLRMAALGYRSLYDPAILIRHLEHGSGAAPVAQALMRRGRPIFQRKHEDILRRRLPAEPANLTLARSPRRGEKRILFIEDTIPLRRLGSGYVRANDIVRSLAAAGHTVSVHPLARSRFDPLQIYPDFPDTVELLHDRDLGNLAAFLKTRPRYYDLIWVSRTHNLGPVLPHCLEAGIDPARVPFVLDTEAIGAAREAARELVLHAHGSDFSGNLQAELEHAEGCRVCVAVNAPEAELLRGAGLGHVAVLGTMREAEPTEAPFHARQDILMVCAIHQPDSPNLDALNWYVEAVLPLLEAQMAEPPVLNIAGYCAPGIDLARFAAHPRIRLHGPAVSLRTHYENNRLFIAPTRFAAGTPYKLYEAAAFGLPIVASELLAAQVGWQEGTELLSAPVSDAVRFAAQIARLYRAPALWERLRRNALARIAAENSEEGFNAALRGVLGAAFGQGEASGCVADQLVGGSAVPV